MNVKLKILVSQTKTNFQSEGNIKMIDKMFLTYFAHI